MKNNIPYQITKTFEDELCAYTGAKYAVAVNSCTAALQLSIEWHFREKRWRLADDPSHNVEIPKRTYVSVPCAIIRGGGVVKWRDERWRGAYQLKPLPVWDCARRFTSGMYVHGQFQCVSFSTSKILGAEQGGAILHDDEEADIWFRRVRFDGRSEGVNPTDDTFDVIGMHCIMLPSTSAELVLKLYHLSEENADLPYFSYPDLSQHPAFK